MVAIARQLAKWIDLTPGLACCWLCEEPLEVGEKSFCSVCFADLPRLPPRCQRWRCQRQDLAAGRFWFAALRWQPEVQKLIQYFKFKQMPDLARVLAPLLGAQLHTCYQRFVLRETSQPVRWPDLIVPMPMSKQRWCERGYNQAGLLAGQLGELMSIPVGYGTLRRLQQESPQHRSNAAERWQNMSHSMHCTRSVKGLTVAVVDDVLTTGASVSAAALALQRCGAVAVDAWTLAYTEPHAPPLIKTD